MFKRARPSQHQWTAFCCLFSKTSTLRRGSDTSPAAPAVTARAAGQAVSRTSVALQIQQQQQQHENRFTSAAVRSKGWTERAARSCGRQQWSSISATAARGRAGALRGGCSLRLARSQATWRRCECQVCVAERAAVACQRSTQDESQASDEILIQVACT